MNKILKMCWKFFRYGKESDQREEKNKKEQKRPISKKLVFSKIIK